MMQLWVGWDEYTPATLGMYAGCRLWAILALRTQAAGLNPLNQITLNSAGGLRGGGTFTHRILTLKRPAIW